MTRTGPVRLVMASTLISLAAFLTACTGSSASTTPASTNGPVDTVSPGTAATTGASAQVEDGVPILTSDAEIIGDPTIVYAHFDGPDDAVWRLLARSDDSAVPLVNVEIQPSSSFDDATANTELFGGRPALVEEFDSGMTRVTFAGADGQWVQFSSFEMEELSLIGLASPLEVRAATIDLKNFDDWIVVGNIDLPLYENGYQTLFNAVELPGVQIEILSSRLTGDLELWYEWSGAERVDDSRFDWAFRQRSGDVGVDRFIALWADDVVVEIHNVENDEDLAAVIDGLREMQPGESEIVPEGPEVNVGS